MNILIPLLLAAQAVLATSAEPSASLQAQAEGTGQTATPAPSGGTGQTALPGEGAAPLPLDEVVRRVQAFYDGVTNYHADFEQTYTNLAMGDTQVSSGRVYFQKPGRMRWDYREPTEKYLISDGSTLWMYEPEFQQVARIDLSTSDLPTAVRFLMGQGNLAEDFAITAADCHVEDAYCLDLVPRVSQGQYRSLRFVVDAHDFSVRETTIVDPVGNTNHFTFSNTSTTDALPPEGFEFTPTADMRVITQ